MPGYLGQSLESGTLEPDVSPYQQKSAGKSTAETFTIGDWDQFYKWFGSDDDDEDTFTEEIHMASSPRPSPSSGVHDDAHEWIELEHEDADPTSYQPGGLAPHLEATSPSDTSSFDSESESESESDEVSEVQREQDVSYAQRTLVIRALYPQRRTSLLPYRKTTVFKPVPLKIQAKEREDRAEANQCPQCDSTIFRMVSEHCLLCTMDQIKRTIQDLEFLGELNEDEYIEANRRLSNRKCAIEDKNPEDYMDDTEWLDLRSEHVELCEKRAEGRADLKDRLFELEAQMGQYSEWAEEDLAKSGCR